MRTESSSVFLICVHLSSSAVNNMTAMNRRFKNLQTVLRSPLTLFLQALPLMGGVENYNGLVRQYFPKVHEFTTITAERPLEVGEEINHRPRNIPAYQSPSDPLDHLKASWAPSPRWLTRDCGIPLQDSLRSPFRFITQLREEAAIPYN